MYWATSSNIIGRYERSDFKCTSIIHNSIIIMYIEILSKVMCKYACRYPLANNM